MSADKVKYMDLLLIASIKDGALDVPFQIYSCTAVKDNRVYYSLDGLKDGDVVLANVHVSIDEYEALSKLPEAIKGFQDDVRVKAFWNTTKRDALSTDDEEGKITIYQGKDALELAPFCVSNLIN